MRSASFVILSIETLPVPQVAEADRLAIDALRLALDAGLECPLEAEEASYFLSTIELRPGDAPGMTRWRKRLFVATSHITADAAEYFGLPRDRTVIMGSLIEV